MKHKACLALLTTALLAGCASSRSVLCIAPQGEFRPESEAALLSELNSQLPFTIRSGQFVARRKSNGFVGWAVVQNDEQKDVAKAKLAHSPTLRLLQVEAFTPEFEAIMNQRKK